MLKLIILMFTVFLSVSAFAGADKTPPFATVQECHQFIDKYSKAVSGLKFFTGKIYDDVDYIKDWWKSPNARSIAVELSSIISGNSVSYGPSLTYAGITYIYSNRQRAYADPGFLQPYREGINSAFYPDSICAGTFDLKEDLKILRDDLAVMIPKLQKINLEKIRSPSIDHAIKVFLKIQSNVNALIAESVN